eukprot:760895_1
MISYKHSLHYTAEIKHRNNHIRCGDRSHQNIGHSILRRTYHRNRTFSVGNCSASSANKCTEIRPPNEKYALAGLRGRADAFIYRIAFTFVNISNNKNEWSKDEIDRITQREKQSIFEYTIRHTPTFVWRDPNVKNEYNSKVFEQDKHVHFTTTTKEAIRLIKQFKQEQRIIHVITNGGDNAKEFINIVRDAMKLRTELVIFCTAVDYVKAWAVNYDNVHVMSGADNLCEWVNSKMFIGNKDGDNMQPKGCETIQGHDRDPKSDANNEIMYEGEIFKLRKGGGP